MNACYNARGFLSVAWRCAALALSLHAGCSRGRNIAPRRWMKSSRSSIKTAASAKLMYAVASPTGLETSFQAGATNFARFSAPHACSPCFLFNCTLDAERTRPSAQLEFLQNEFIHRISVYSLGQRRHWLTQFPFVSIEWHQRHRYDSQRGPRFSLRFCASHGANESLLSGLKVFPPRSSSCCPPQ